MLDLGLSKIAIIGVVALVVIGPERLPRVARLVGTMLGRAQRYIADVKAEVGREMQLDELRSMHDTVREAASNVQSTVMREFHKTGAELDSTFRGALNADTPVEGSTVVFAPLMTPAKRRTWRRNVLTRQTALPGWYKLSQRKRTRVISAAARVARYRARSS